jgi:hypothetical protein
MIKFKMNEVEYKLPEQLTIEHYVKIYKMQDLFEDEYFAAKLISLLTGAPQKELLEYDYQEINFLAAEILGMLPTAPKFEDRFELDGIKYGFFPNWKDLTFAEFVDLDTLSSKKPDELLDSLHYLTAIMYRPITEERGEHDFDIEKYDVKTMKKRAELFKKKLNVRYVLGAQTFFTQLEKRFLGYSQLSSIKKLSMMQKIKLIWSMRKMIIQTLFKKRTGGTSSSIDYLETILQNTK